MTPLVSATFLLFFIFGIFVVHVFSILGGWYLAFTWIDIPLHIAGGAWVASLFFYLWDNYLSQYPRMFPRWFLLVLVVGFVMAVGVFWEWFEYGYDYFFAKEKASWRAQLGLPDTMGDLFSDFVGGLLLGWYFICKDKNQQKKVY